MYNKSYKTLYHFRRGDYISESVLNIIKIRLGLDGVTVIGYLQ